MKVFIKEYLINELNVNTLLRTEIALALEITERAVYNTVKAYLQNPIPNSSLTKWAAIKCLQDKGYALEDIITEQPVT